MSKTWVFLFVLMCFYSTLADDAAGNTNHNLTDTNIGNANLTDDGDIANDKGTKNNGTEHNGTKDKETEDNETEHDHTKDKDTEDNGTVDNGTKDKGTEDNGTEHDDTKDKDTEDNGTEDNGTKDKNNVLPDAPQGGTGTLNLTSSKIVSNPNHTGNISTKSSSSMEPPSGEDVVPIVPPPTNSSTPSATNKALHLRALSNGQKISGKHKKPNNKLNTVDSTKSVGDFGANPNEKRRTYKRNHEYIASLGWLNGRNNDYWSLKTSPTENVYPYPSDTISSISNPLQQPFYPDYTDTYPTPDRYNPYQRIQYRPPTRVNNQYPTRNENYHRNSLNELNRNFYDRNSNPWQENPNLRIPRYDNQYQTTRNYPRNYQNVVNWNFYDQQPTAWRYNPNQRSYDDAYQRTKYYSPRNPIDNQYTMNQNYPRNSHDKLNRSFSNQYQTSYHYKPSGNINYRQSSTQYAKDNYPQSFQSTSSINPESYIFQRSSKTIFPSNYRRTKLSSRFIFK